MSGIGIGACGEPCIISSTLISCLRARQRAPFLTPRGAENLQPENTARYPCVRRAATGYTRQKKPLGTPVCLELPQGTLSLSRNIAAGLLLRTSGCAAS